MIQQLSLAQYKNGNGYLVGVPFGRKIGAEIREGNIRVGSFLPNDRWVPLYNIHEMYAGLRHAWQIAGIEKARDMLIQFSERFYLLTKNFTETQFQELLISGYEELNEIFADVAEITGEKKFSTLPEIGSIILAQTSRVRQMKLM